MAASPDTQEELDTHSTSESESVDFCDSGDDLEVSASWAGINSSLIYQFESYRSRESEGERHVLQL